MTTVSIMSSGGGDSGGGDSEPVSGKKRGRGLSQITNVIAQPGKKIEFDKLGRPIVNQQTTSFSSQLGIIVKRHVPITCQDWSKVEDSKKKRCWEEMKLGWTLPDEESFKKKLISQMADYHRRFRTKMTKYVNKGETPDLEKHSITQQEWDAFVESRQSEEFRNLSEKGRVNQSKNMYPHFLGSRGYSGEKFQCRLKAAFQTIADENASGSDPSTQGSTTALSQEQLVDMSVQHRHVPWKLGRQKLSDDGQEVVYPNPETKAAIMTIEEKEADFNKGLLPVERYDDVLGKSLPNQEHAGRVRGIEALVGIKRTYEGCGKRRRNTVAESEANFEQRVQREVAERVESTKREMESLKREVEKIQSQNREMEERLKRKMEERLSTMVQQQMAMLMGQRQMDTDSPRAVQSSCQSVQPPQFLDSTEKEERRCKLHMVRDENKIEVALGTIHLPVVQGEIIHCRPMPLDHAKVMVDAFLPGEEDTPLPVPNDELVTIRSAVGSFTAWPMNMLSLDEEKNEPRKELQVLMGENLFRYEMLQPSRYKKFDDINFDKLGPNFKSLRERFLNQEDNKFCIDLPPDLFHCQSSIDFHADDLLDLVTPKTWLNAHIIRIYMMYAHKHYKKSFPNELVGFMDPSKTCSTVLDDDECNRAYVDAYLKNALKENRDKKLIFIPYHQGVHWVLVLLMPRESHLFVFNSEKKISTRLKIIDALADPFLLKTCSGGPGKVARLKVTHCKCPQQRDGWECGYYVMLFVHDIITRFLDVFPNLKDFPASYSNANMDNIRMLWGKFFLKELLIQKTKTI